MVKKFFNIKYLENGTSYSCTDNGRLIGSRICSIEWCHFQLPWIVCTRNTNFKEKPLVDVERFRNGTR